MSEQKITAGARCILTVEVSALGTWGGECSAAQVHKQAVEQAVGRLCRLFEKESHVRIIGRVMVEMVTSVDER